MCMETTSGDIRNDKGRKLLGISGSCICGGTCNELVPVCGAIRVLGMVRYSSHGGVIIIVLRFVHGPCGRAANFLTLLHHLLRVRIPQRGLFFFICLGLGLSSRH